MPSVPLGSPCLPLQPRGNGLSGRSRTCKRLVSKTSAYANSATLRWRQVEESNPARKFWRLACSQSPCRSKYGRGGRIRTCDLSLPRRARCQAALRPDDLGCSGGVLTLVYTLKRRPLSLELLSIKLVVAEGFEPSSPCLRGTRFTIELRHNDLVASEGLEPSAKQALNLPRMPIPPRRYDLERPRELESRFADWQSAVLPIGRWTP